MLNPESELHQSYLSLFKQSSLTNQIQTKFGLYNPVKQ